MMQVIYIPAPRLLPQINSTCTAKKILLKHNSPEQKQWAQTSNLKMLHNIMSVAAVICLVQVPVGKTIKLPKNPQPPKTNHQNV